jgi:hypothetical protein
MDAFIHDENLRHYRRLLERTADPAERERILRLVAEEEEKIRTARKPPGPERDRRQG